MADTTDALTAMVARGLIEDISQKLNESLEIQKKLLKLESKTGEIRQTKLIDDLGISPSTLKVWNEQGLTPINRGGSVFYLLEDLHRFNY
ncbi:transcriptional regulator [Lactococcus lactis]|uniref:Transcriptional regulator n=1 Tax=Lactococcus lactis TaxID=1358 RepID=A0AAP3Z2N1_9LACT|nr:transcriptional regulator [Lactococcus lactis]MDG4969286.1 transcriptional regulator [Lactococcus lactis]MDG4977217.1 transcriptional regulator [Lactococcus lactis]MDG5103381.1 transcriptional regulator [Lactococcus lactis]TNU78279.1 transcriptional regulator [Lactococcus lactis subsp. lactis]